MFISRQTHSYTFKWYLCVGGASPWWTHVFSLPRWLDAQKTLGCCPLDNESRRTSWWSNGSHFLPYLSPQVLGPRFYFRSVAPSRAVWYCKSSHPRPSASFCHHKKDTKQTVQNLSPFKWQNVRFYWFLHAAWPHVIKKQKRSKPLRGGTLLHSTSVCCFSHHLFLWLMHSFNMINENATALQFLSQATTISLIFFWSLNKIQLF